MPLYGCDCYAYALLASGYVDLVIESGLKVSFVFCAIYLHILSGCTNLSSCVPFGILTIAIVSNQICYLVFGRSHFIYSSSALVFIIFYACRSKSH